MYVNAFSVVSASERHIVHPDFYSLEHGECRTYCGIGYRDARVEWAALERDYYCERCLAAVDEHAKGMES